MPGSASPTPAAGGVPDPARLALGRARYRDPYPNPDPMFGWYGAEPAFHVRLERDMAEVHGIAGPITRHLEPRVLTYKVSGLEVPGDLERHDLTIAFQRGPLGSWASGIAPCDYPAVHTSINRTRKHQNVDGSLCLWASYDPPERRWWHGEGIQALVEITRRHLLLELHWLSTGGEANGEWAVDDAPHGAPDVKVLV